MERSKHHSVKSERIRLIRRAHATLMKLDFDCLDGRNQLLYLGTLAQIYAQKEIMGLTNEHTIEDRVKITRECFDRCNNDDRDVYASSLVRALLTYAQQTNEVQALESAQQIIGSELSSTSGDAYRRSQCLELEGKAMLIAAQFAVNRGTTESLHAGACWKAMRTAIDLPGLSPVQILNIYQRWAWLAEKCGDSDAAAEAYKAAIHLLPRVAYLGQDLLERMQALHQAQDLSTRAATHSLSCDDVSTAVNMLERGRGIVWSQSLYLRAPFEQIPEPLRSKFRDIAAQLDKIEGLSPIQRRIKADEFDNILAEVRANPEHRDFLLPHDIDLVQVHASLVASREFVVMIVPGPRQCSALIFGVAKNANICLRFDNLDEHDLMDLAEQFVAETTRSRNAASQLERTVGLSCPGTAQDGKYSDLLSQLWNTLACRIIEALEIPKTRGRDRPRLWWCIAGHLSCLPFHAAGIYAGKTQDNVSSYVVSSYTPTLASLLSLKSNLADGMTRGSNKILMLAQPNVPGLPLLSEAERELSIVREIIGADAILDFTPREEGVADALLARLGEATILHLACHGKQDHDDSLKSGFVLTDGCLTLGKLAQARATRAELAYLSACESAAMDKNQPNEVINLAAAMLFVGFKSVIATLWSMSDQDGPFVAEQVYGSIFNEKKEWDLAAIPYALDNAVRHLRESGAHASRWATYVHVGV